MKSLLCIAALAVFLAMIPEESKAVSIMDLLPSAITGSVLEAISSGKQKDSIEVDYDSESLLGVEDSEDEDRHHGHKPHKFHFKPLHKPHHKPHHDEHDDEHEHEHEHHHVQKPKPVIIKTKTLVLEVTKTLVRNPVCMTVLGILPPCHPPKIHEAHPHPPGSPHTPQCREETARFIENEADDIIEEDELFGEVQPTAAVKSAPTLSTSFLYSDDEDEFDDSDQDSERAGRFLSMKKTPKIPAVKSVINEAEIESVDDSEVEEKGEGRFFLKKAEKRWVTKTIWVTKVQKVTDYKVTATLAAVNCVPNNPHIAKCHGHHHDFHTQPILHPQQPHPVVEEHHEIAAPIHHGGLAWKNEEDEKSDKSKVTDTSNESAKEEEIAVTP